MALPPELFNCENERRDLQDHLSALPGGFEQKSTRCKIRMDQMTLSHRALGKCLEEKDLMAAKRSALKEEIERLKDSIECIVMDEVEAETELALFAANIRLVQQQNENMRINLQKADNEVKVLSEENKSLQRQLSGETDDRR